MTKELLIETENRIKAHWENGDIPYLTHLCGGNEDWLIEYYSSNFKEGDWVFCSHRTHYHALLSGAFTPDELVAEVLAGRSMFTYAPRFLCSAIVGGSIPIATGKALSVQLRCGSEHVHCFLGDGAWDQGIFCESLRFSDARRLPITFIIEDNGGQCGVSIMERWGDAVSSQELMDSMVRLHGTQYYSYQPTYPHAGTLGPDGKPTRPPIRLS